MKKLNLRLASVLCVLALLLSACSNSSNSSSGASNSGSQASSGSDGVDYGSLTLTMGSTGAAEDISTQAMTYMKEYIEEKSGGAIQLNLFPSSQLGQATDQLEMTGQGSIDLFLEANYMSNNGVTEAKVASLTFTYTSKDQYRALMESDLQKQWEDKFCELNNIKIIANNWYRKVGGQAVLGRQAL